MALQYGFGAGVLYGLRNDVANATPVRFGTLQDVSLDFSGDIKELYGSQQYAVDVARGKVKIMGKAKFAQLTSNTFNNLFFGQTQTTGQKLQAFNEAQTVTVLSPIVISTNAAASIGATVLSLTQEAGLYVGMVVTATGIPANTTITAMNATLNTVTLSAALTGAITSGTNITFTPASANTSASTSIGSAVLTFTAIPVGAVAGMLVGNGVTGIPTGTTIVSTTSTTITMSNTATAVINSGTSISVGAMPNAVAANGATFDLDLGPLYASTGLAFSYTPATPTLVGTYSVNTATGQYIFSPFDAGASVLLNYTYATTAGYKINSANPLMGTTPKFQCAFAQTYNGNTSVFKLLSCVASKLSLPTKIDDYVISELDFQAFANAAGNVFELSTSQ